MKNQINTFPITQLTLASHSLFHIGVDDTILNCGVALYIAELIEPYSEAVAAEKSVVNRPSSYSETPQMVKVNALRDSAISLAFNIVNAALKSTLEAEIKAAERLHAIMAAYHGIQKHEYTKKTNETDGLLIALNSAAPADISLFALNSAIIQMETHNSAFKQLLAERTTDVGIRMPVATADTNELRHDADAKYHGIVQLINAHAIVKSTPELEAFITEINALIVQYKRIVENQGKGHKEEEEVPTEPTEPVVPIEPVVT